MDDAVDTAADDAVEVRLRGGPADLPETIRLPRSDLTKGKLRIPRYGGYEHFELAVGDVADGGTVTAFEWTMRTRIAE